MGKKVYKLNIYKDSDLAVVKSLPWCGGATITRKFYDSSNVVSYYTVFVKPTNLIQKMITKYVIKNLEYTIGEEMAA